MILRNIAVLTVEKLIAVTDPRIKVTFTVIRTNKLLSVDSYKTRKREASTIDTLVSVVADTSCLSIHLLT